MSVTRLLTLDEVTDRLGVSRRAVATLVASRELPTVLIGKRSVRVRPCDLEDYIVEQLRLPEPSEGPEASRARVRAGKPRARSAS